MGSAQTSRNRRPRRGGALGRRVGRPITAKNAAKRIAAMIWKCGMQRSRWRHRLIATTAAIAGGGLGCGGAAFTTEVGPGAEAGVGSEGGTPGEASVAEGAAGTWCASQGSHTFCEDFDTLMFPASFGENASVGTMLAYDSLDVRSAPHSVVAITPATTTTTALAVATLSR